jgi:hypothetical protein
MTALIEKGACYNIAHEYAGGMKYYHLTVKTKRHLRKALAALCELSINTVIPINMKLPHGFRLPEQEPRKLIHIAARNLCVLGQKAAITAPRMSKEVERVFNAILPYTGSLSIYCGNDTKRAAHYILKHYGLAAVEFPPDTADLHIDLVNLTVNGKSLNGIDFTLKDAPAPPRGADEKLWNYALLESGLFEPLTITCW